ncbi:PIN domain-containing protein [Rhizobium sp. Rhizsp42]|uniref:PIN domain-containing protein n=1 Tax=Rhizobium sp. Rhizsp42 TaxID=3243034 RepID=UPI0039B03489
MTTAFLLDTCVISETNLPDPDPRIMRFLEATEQFYLPAGALIELMMGITQVCATNPLKAVKLSAWYHELMRSGLPIVETDRDVIEIMGVLIADNKLKNLWERQLNSEGKVTGKPRGGQDLHIAAAALARRLPIATMNVRDFMMIDAIYPLPGIYDPKEGIWHRRMEPLSERYPIETANDDNASSTLDLVAPVIG